MHIPVLRDKITELLEPLEEKVILDATLGTGGHAEALLERIGATGMLIGLDQDADALKIARERLSRFSDKARFVQSNFAHLQEALNSLGVTHVDGIIMDLGLSSLQLEDETRGFSFQHEALLDMRMDRRQQLTARDIVNQLDEKKLGGLFREYGEERFAWRIAAAIGHFRRKNPINTTTELAQLVERAIPRKAWPRHIHPATRVFQALRIVVNQELESLRKGLIQATEVLREKGRLLVISYHSLEDRMVKHFFKDLKFNGWTIITPKPIVPTEEEISENRKARSAKLRVLERAA